MPTIRLLLALWLVSAAGCVTVPRPRTDAPITVEELEAVAGVTVLDAVRELRPHWLNRVAGVYLDGEAVPVWHLQAQPVHSIERIRLLSADDATAIYNTRTLTARFLDVTRRW